MRLDLNIKKEYDFNNAMEFIRFFKLEKLARKIWNIPKSIKIEEWEWFAPPYDLTDEEVIGTLLEHMNGCYFYEYIPEDDGYFIVKKLKESKPYLAIGKSSWNPSMRE